MNFQTLQKVEKPDFYLDVAIKAGKRRADRAAEKVTKKGIQKIRIIELARIQEVSLRLQSKLDDIITSFPNLDELDPFYQELVKLAVDYGQLKHCFGGVGWAIRKVREFHKIYSKKILRSADKTRLFSVKKEFYGRISSAVKQISKELEFLEASRRTLKSFPSIKTGIDTIVIAGYPNVGKTTLLRAITGSAPKVDSYPFTTQKLMLGYAEIKDEKVQFIDTPGLLDRPLSSRNKIELHAILALKHLAKKIIFVIDGTETCGYTIDEQLSLMKQISSKFDVPIIMVENKSDLEGERKKHAALKKVMQVSAEKGKGIDQLKKKL